LREITAACSAIHAQHVIALCGRRTKF